MPASQALAACDLTPTAGNSVYICDSGTSGALTDLDGNNSLTMPESGSGTIDGNVVFGPGADTVIIHSGTINGNVQQGAGIDDFQMTGGQIQSLNQGDALDTFLMSGGRIVDFFDDGDRAVMTGGRIGRVNMKLDKNYFNMSGGTIDRNLVTGFDEDTIIISGGTIGGNISVSGGNDTVTVTGGSIGGDVLMSFGEDSFTWDGGGIIYGNVDLGGDNDTASLSNLTDAHIGATKTVNGGLGTDALTLENVKTGGVGRFDNWETIDLTNDTRLTFDDTLVLGDSGTGTGTLTVDAASTIYGGGANGGISAFDAGQLAEVFNSGRIDLTNGGDSTSDTFTIAGNYTGDNGLLFLNTVLGDDSSASDKLVIDGGAASGTTGLSVINAGGAGAATTQDGIMVVETVNGGTTAGGAFALNSRVAAGAFEYYLFKGGVSDNTEENWYLRSTLVPDTTAAPAPDPVTPTPPEPQPEEPETVAPPPPPAQDPPPLEVDPDDPDPQTSPDGVEVTDPEPEAPPPAPPADPASPPPPPPDVPTAPAPLPGSATTPPTPGATPVVAEVVPLYRVEVPVYSAVPPVAHHLGLATLGTFHERRGEQSLLNGAAGYLPTSWGRIFGQDIEMEWEGTVAPGFDGNLFGFQAGQDIYGWESDGGHFDRAGLFVAYTSMSGDIKGQALGWNNLAVGDLDIHGTSFGGYWTHIGPQGWYLDGVAMATWFGGDATSSSGQSIDIDGTGVTLSLEGGYPFQLSPQWVLEPQAQLIWQHLSLDDTADSFSSISFDADDAVTGRVGLRLQGNYDTFQPYLKANLWHNFSSDQTINFDGDPILTEMGGTSLEFGGGVIAKLSENVSLFATADYTTNLGGEKTRVFEGNVGLSVKW